MLETIVSLLTFTAGSLAVFAINLVITDIFERDRKEAEKRREELLRIEQRERARNAAKGSQSKSLSSLAAEAKRETVEQRSLLERIDDLLEQSGLRWTPAKLMSTSGLFGALPGLLVYLVTRNMIFGVATMAVGATLPMLYVNHKRRQRLEKLRGQLPDALELMSRILRSGQTITQAMQSVAAEFKAPVATEFGYCYEQQNLGLAPELALKDLTKRTGLLEIKIFVLAMLVHRQSGGNLAELLDKLAHIVRERFKIRGKIRSLTAEGRLQAIMLIALPPIMFGLLLIVNRGYAVKLFDHPQLLVGTLMSMLVGAFFIRKIVNFDF